MSETMSPPTQQVSDWLATFGEALSQRDVAAAVQMFDTESYWRDLVTFTWNIATLEGQDAIRDMLTATLAEVQPSQWQIEGEGASADGVTEAWITFETAVARGKGHVRLKGDKCWTLLTTMTKLKGYEEKHGPTRKQGVAHGAFQDRQTWLERKAQEEAELGYTRQPYCVIIGGGQGALRSAQG
ncbi:MAG: hypothetical protein ETSY1_37695 [Candidatus Entotheonella factor]|uniref:SnoaL-like domain-containing protein n=1 Tax=Entotheonella factor TaxID=1429438 RepID=W4L812_ENTF1|nr:MAG: hypothetical protein ETSY1_37695 [Candidatus Entotheonella factor]